MNKNYRTRFSSKLKEVSYTDKAKSVAMYRLYYLIIDYGIHRGEEVPPPHPMYIL